MIDRSCKTGLTKPSFSLSAMQSDSDRILESCKIELLELNVEEIEQTETLIGMEKETMNEAEGKKVGKILFGHVA